MTKSSMHYRGFIDTLVRYGIEKDAADRIYKEAANALVEGALGLLPKGLGLIKGLFRGGAKNVATEAAAAGRNAATAGRNAAAASRGSAQQAAQATQQATRATRQGILTEGRGIQRGMRSPKTSRVDIDKAVERNELLRQGRDLRARALTDLARSAQAPRPISRVRPTPQSPATPTPSTPQPGAPQPTGGATPPSTPPPGAPQPTGGATPPSNPPPGPLTVGNGAAEISSNAQQAANAAAGNKRWWQKGLLDPYFQFVSKHPIMGTTATMLGTGYFVNKANNNFKENPAYNTVNTMTPSESMRWNRMRSGNYLPGLGLDPYYFNGAI